MVAYVVLNWNSPEMTISAIEKLEKYELSVIKNSIVIVVDNGSVPEKKELLIRYFKREGGKILLEGDNTMLEQGKTNKFLIINKKNYGYARGNNIGLKFARSLGFRYAVVMNNDVEVIEPVTMKLLDIMISSKDIAVVGPSVRGPDGKQQGPFEKNGIYTEFIFPALYPFLYPIEKIRNHRRKRRLTEEVSIHGYAIVYRLMGCFMLVDLEKMDEVGWFDENTFLYAEESILSEKLEKKGYKTAFVPTVSVLHHHEVSAKSYLGKNRWLTMLNSDLYYYRTYRNYNKVLLFLIKAGRIYRVCVLNPFISFFKNCLRITKKFNLLKRR